MNANAQRTVDIILQIVENVPAGPGTVLSIRWHMCVYVTKTKTHSKCTFFVKKPVAMSGSAENFCPVWFQRLMIRNAIASTVEAVAGLMAFDNADPVLVRRY